MIDARSPGKNDEGEICTGCHGEKKAPIATIVHISHRGGGVQLTLCQECARDAANAIGFFCIRDGGWSKLEPRKRKTAKTAKEDQKVPR